MSKFLRLSLFLIVILASSWAEAFSVPGHHKQQRSLFPRPATASDASSSQRRMGELTSTEQRVFDLLQRLHDSQYAFRIVVVGNGAILETTSTLGPTLSVSQSPKTGKNLMTLASNDKSFEFHLSLADVTQVAILEKETPAKTMRIIRVSGGGGDDDKQTSMCSLILADSSDDASAWFQELQKELGETIDLTA
jgi:hypothetical protein